MEAKNFWSARLFGLGILVIVIVLGLRGDLFYLFSLPSLFFLVAGLCLQTILICYSRTVFDKLVARKLPPQRAMWLIPLLCFACQLGLLLIFLVGPHLLSWSDFWAEKLSLPTRVVARLAVDSFILLAFSTLTQFFVVVRHALSTMNQNGKSDDLHARDMATTMVLFGGSLIVLILLIHWQLGMPDNLLFCRGLVALNVENNPQRALTLFEELLEKYPKSRLVDTTLLRAGRVHQEILGNREAARNLYEQLEERCKESPWRDDAAYRKIALLLHDKELAAQSQRELKAFVKRYPQSCYADDALCHLVRLYHHQGAKEEAKKLLARLQVQYPWGRMFFPRHVNYPWNIRSTVTVANEFLAVDVH